MLCSLLKTSLFATALAFPPVALFPPTARPQTQATSDWEVFMLKSAQAFASQNYGEAEKQAKLALEFSSRFHPEDFRIEKNHRMLGQIYQAENHFAQAEAAFQKALSVHHQRVGSGDDNSPECLEDLAQLYELESKYAEAEPLRQRALQMIGKVYDGKGNWVAERMENLAAVYSAEQKYAAADELYQKSLELKEEQYGRDSTQLAGTLQKKAEVVAHLGRQSEAAALRDRASRLLGKRQ